MRRLAIAVVVLVAACAAPDVPIPDAVETSPAGQAQLDAALRDAAWANDVEQARRLIASGANVNAKDRGGQTAIMWAAAEGHADVVKLLIDAQSEFQEPLPSGFTPLLFACRAGHVETAKALIAAGADVKAAMQPKKSVAKGVEPECVR